MKNRNINTIINILLIAIIIYLSLYIISIKNNNQQTINEYLKECFIECQINFPNNINYESICRTECQKNGYRLFSN